MNNSFRASRSPQLLINRTSLLVLVFLSLGISPAFSQSFTNVAFTGAGGAGAALAIGGNKDGGFAWGDINNDGCLDLVVNTNDGTQRSRILIANCSDPNNPTFTDQTNALCKGLLNNTLERCALLEDLDGDGDLDLTRNTSSRLEIYLNRGASEGYVFGVGINQTPNLTLSTPNVNSATGASIPGGMNTEGLMYSDYDGDGDLDLIIENHNYGIDMYQNDGNANFTYVNPTTIGLPTSATTGDYASAVDFDHDGWVDIIARKEGQTDLYRNTGGTFAAGVEIGNANNSNKGGVVFADFDNDGDFDLYWTDQGTQQIWLQSGVGSGTFVATKPSGAGSDWGEPWLSAGVSAPGITDGVAVGDVNNDGKVDLFIAANSGTSFLFINNTPTGGTLSFTRNNYGINVNGNAEGVAFADYDNDGDLDLYINRSGGNQLWRNNLTGGSAANYLFVDARIDLGGGLSRPATGANVIIRDCASNIIGGIRDVSTCTGHGTSPDKRVHFGIPSGPSETYMIEVGFVNASGARTTVRKLFTPNAVSDQTVSVTNTEVVGSIVCATFPVELLDFSAKSVGFDAQLDWATAWETNSSHFIVERSVDGNIFESVSPAIRAAGNSSEVRSYTFTDTQLPLLGRTTVYYRLKQIDLNGSFEYSNLESLTIETPRTMVVSAFPNPATDFLSLHVRTDRQQRITWRLIDLSGKTLRSGSATDATEEYRQQIPVEQVPTGIYYLQVTGSAHTQSQRILISR